MEINKDDFKLAIECATHVTFHYYNNIDVTILDEKVIEELKQVMLKHIQ